MGSVATMHTSNKDVAVAAFLLQRGGAGQQCKPHSAQLESPRRTVRLSTWRAGAATWPGDPPVPWRTTEPSHQRSPKWAAAELHRDNFVRPRDRSTQKGALSCNHDASSGWRGSFRERQKHGRTASGATLRAGTSSAKLAERPRRKPARRAASVTGPMARGSRNSNLPLLSVLVQRRTSG
jgi:hypothetical protein